MASESGPRVLLGNLGPIMRLGMNRVLSEQGCQVVGHEDRPSAIIGEAHRLRPDIVVLDLDGGSSFELAQLVRGASPETAVVLWARRDFWRSRTGLEHIAIVSAPVSSGSAAN
jgi:DNA-binding NarL/FixJ family response regulator